MSHASICAGLPTEPGGVLRAGSPAQPEAAVALGEPLRMRLQREAAELVPARRRRQRRLRLEAATARGELGAVGSVAQAQSLALGAGATDVARALVDAYLAARIAWLGAPGLAEDVAEAIEDCARLMGFASIEALDEAVRLAPVVS